uniref:L1 transposable element RRM domain-containing protein n=1 Tax=Oryzias latipes TaxID=8090 RepID=A0A3P9M7X3_ORYLA
FLGVAAFIKASKPVTPHTVHPSLPSCSTRRLLSFAKQSLFIFISISSLHLCSCPQAMRHHAIQTSAFITHILQITESENRISEDEDRITSLENQVSELQQKVKTLTERCDDGENRSRRENIRIIGLKEGSEGQSSVTFFESWLPEVLGMETKRGVIKLDRAHRALGPPKEDRCRPVIIKLHNFTDKQRILTAAREKGQIIYKGSRIYIRQDFSAQVREARQKFNGTCQRLIKGGVRFSMRYPATLCFSLKGAERSFRSAQAAEELNPTLLSSQDFVDYITKEWEGFIAINKTPEISPSTLWESGKAYIRGSIISYTSAQ